ncbi:MAG: sigma-70 family RNA polymerase sigma factor [Phycisphaerales bacterium]|nr:sigma-70 family RNA polymerase sigma factor [Phycisphaerales bacterium]
MITDTAARTQIYGWALRLLRNHHDALDATQEVILRVLRQPARDVRNPAAWLRRVTVNHCLDVIRARRPEACPAPEPVETAGPLQHAARIELQAAVITGLATLSEQQRAVLVAKVYDQETFAAIADDMELAIPTVKTHYVRALRAMRRSLHPHAELDP